MFLPNGSAMKTVAKLVDGGKVMKCCLLQSFCLAAVLMINIDMTYVKGLQ